MSPILTFVLSKVADFFAPKAGAASKRVLRRLSRRSRIALVGVAILAVLGFLLGPSIHLLLRVAAKASQIPLEGRVAATLRSTTDHVSRRVLADLMDDAAAGESGWAVAQAIVAVDELPADSRRTAINALLNTVDSECACWQGSSDSGHPPHTVHTAWSLHALAKQGSAPPPAVVDRLLASQHASGAWAIHPGSEYGSAYATALVLLALQELVERDVIDLRRQVRAKRAIDLGNGWLAGWQLPGQVRWRDYPDIETGDTLPSVSGLVLFTLHRLEREDMRTMDRLWLRTLPSRPPAWDAVDRSRDLRVTQMSRSTDAVTIPQWPWLVLATVAAYPHGNVREQAGAVRWLEQAISTSGMDREQFTRGRGTPEFLIALRALIRDVA